MASIKHVVKEMEFKQNLVGEGFLKPPKSNFSRVNIFGEISQLENFYEDNLYLSYEFDFPLGWKVDDENEYYNIYKEENVEEANINKIKGVTQKVMGTPKEADDKINLIHVLNTNFEMEMLCHNAVLKANWPKLLLQINSIDSWGRNRIEGYAFMNLPSQSGFYSLRLDAYKPIEDNYLMLFSNFLGGSRRIVDIKELSRTSSINEENISVPLNRYGITTENSGQIILNFNIVIQNAETLEKERAKFDDLKVKLGIEAMIEEVEELEDKEQIQMHDAMRTGNFDLVNRLSGK